MSPTNNLPPAAQVLEKSDLPFSVFRHQGQVSSLEQAAKERNQASDQVIRSIVFRLGEGKFIMVLMAGPGQISWSALRSYLGQSRITMATPEEVLDITGYEIGTVSPIGSTHPLRILADESVFRPETVSFGSGERNVGILMKSADLKKILSEVEISRFSGTK